MNPKPDIQSHLGGTMLLTSPAVCGDGGGLHQLRSQHLASLPQTSRLRGSAKSRLISFCNENRGRYTVR